MTLAGGCWWTWNRRRVGHHQRAGEPVNSLSGCVDLAPSGIICSRSWRVIKYRFYDEKLPARNGCHKSRYNRAPLRRQQ